MAYNGSGTFNRLYSWVADAANSINIDATRMDNEMNGMATALTDCVTRDGQSPWLANLPAGGFKITGLANGTAPTDSATVGQITTAISTGNAFRKNWIINGAMQVSQRFVATTPTISAATAYVVDRWQLKTGAGQVGQPTQATGIGNTQFQFAERVQRQNGNAAVTTLQLAQSLESFDSYPMAGQTVTLSFWARAGANYSAAASALGVAVHTGTGVDQNVLLPYTGDASPLSNNVTLTTSWQRFALTGALSSAATEVGVVFTMTPTGTAGANDYFDVTGVQLEVASQATDFDHQPFELTFLKALRYYQKSFAYGTVPVQGIGVGNGEYTWQQIGAAAAITVPGFVFVAPMRTTPAMTTYNIAGANANARNETRVNDGTVGGTTTTNGRFFSISVTNSVGSSAGDFYGIHWSADAEL